MTRYIVPVTEVNHATARFETLAEARELVTGDSELAQDLSWLHWSTGSVSFGPIEDTEAPEPDDAVEVTDLAPTRRLALDLLQVLDPNGTYTDEASSADSRRPCSLSEAIRAAASLIEGALPAGNVPPQELELLRRLADWAGEVAR